MKYLGNIAAGQTLNFLFSTNDQSGAAVEPSDGGTVGVYKDGDDASSTTAGVGCSLSFNGVTGVNLVTIDTSDAFYESEHDYSVVLSGAVIDGETVNAALASFSIANRYPAPESNADALLDRADGIEANTTLRQAMRIVAAVLAGKVSGAGSGNEQFTGLDGATLRVEVTTDPAGNRTNVTYG
jgi:hypothetical protein